MIQQLRTAKAAERTADATERLANSIETLVALFTSCAGRNHYEQSGRKGRPPVCLHVLASPRVATMTSSVNPDSST